MQQFTCMIIILDGTDGDVRRMVVRYEYQQGKGNVIRRMFRYGMLYYDMEMIHIQQ